jgi:hypothetical protein
MGGCDGKVLRCGAGDRHQQLIETLQLPVQGSRGAEHGAGCKVRLVQKPANKGPS